MTDLDTLPRGAMDYLTGDGVVDFDSVWGFEGDEEIAEVGAPVLGRKIISPERVAKVLPRLAKRLEHWAAGQRLKITQTVSSRAPMVEGYVFEGLSERDRIQLVQSARTIAAPSQVQVVTAPFGPGAYAIGFTDDPAAVSDMFTAQAESSAVRAGYARGRAEADAQAAAGREAPAQAGAIQINRGNPSGVAAAYAAAHLPTRDGFFVQPAERRKGNVVVPGVIVRHPLMTLVGRGQSRATTTPEIIRDFRVTARLHAKRAGTRAVVIGPNLIGGDPGVFIGFTAAPLRVAGIAMEELWNSVGGMEELWDSVAGMEELWDSPDESPDSVDGVYTYDDGVGFVPTPMYGASPYVPGGYIPTSYAPAYAPTYTAPQPVAVPMPYYEAPQQRYSSGPEVIVLEPGDLGYEGGSSAAYGSSFEGEGTGDDLASQYMEYLRAILAAQGGTAAENPEQYGAGYGTDYGQPRQKVPRPDKQGQGSQRTTMTPGQVQQLSALRNRASNITATPLSTKIQFPRVSASQQLARSVRRAGVGALADADGVTDASVNPVAALNAATEEIYAGVNANGGRILYCIAAIENGRPVRRLDIGAAGSRVISNDDMLMLDRAVGEIAETHGLTYRISRIDSSAVRVCLRTPSAGTRPVSAGTI